MVQTHCMNTEEVSNPFELVGVDLVGPLAETESGNKYIFTATDYFTKWVEAFPIPSKHATVVSRCFKQLFARHGAMNAVLTDQGREFVNQVNDQLCADWNIQHKVTAAYHPQTNGLDERTNQTLKATLRKMVNEHQNDWDTFLDGALFAMRTKPQSSTKYSPFFLLYGREARYPSQLPKDFGSDLQTENIPSTPTEDTLMSFDERRQEASATACNAVITNVDKAQEKQKKDYKQRQLKGRPYTDLVVGQRVLLHNSRKAGTKRKGNLQQNYFGPYTITAIQGKTATLQNRTGHTLKKKANVDTLKAFVATEHDTMEATVDQDEGTVDQDEGTVDQDAAKDVVESLGPTQMPNPVEEEVSKYLRDISADGSLDRLISFVRTLPFTRPTLHDLAYHYRVCPLQSFLREVNNQDQVQMESFGTKLMPYIRHLEVNLSDKTSIAMLLSAVCARAASLFQPVSIIAETLTIKPGHMKDVPMDLPPLDPTARLTVGGETLENIDLTTLQETKWLNDKVINSFLAVLKINQNKADSNSHVFILPSYAAVQWDQGKLDHWMFKKVQFSMYKHVLMPICVHGNHWVLLVANIRERTVAVLDSMHGQVGHHWTRMWTQFMEIRDGKGDISEKLGPWTISSMQSSKQTDSSSCGIFTLMNAECILEDRPIQIMRQVHCASYRRYVRSLLLQAGTTKPESTCDMPDCRVERGTHRWVQCCVCGRWLHTKCCGLATKAAIEDDYECCFCEAMYRYACVIDKSERRKTPYTVIIQSLFRLYIL